MTTRALGHQFVRDLKASWPRTALLVILLLVGLRFWIPPLYRAATGAFSSTAAGTEEKRPEPGTALSAATSTTTGQAGTSVEKQFVEHTWEQVEQISQTDPLVRSAEVAALKTSPFHINRDQFPPPVLFASEPEPLPVTVPAEPVAEVEMEAGPPAPSDLVLRSTIVGVRRRAAYINRKLYFVGSAIQSGETTWLLKTVEPRRVILQNGTTEVELKIQSASAEDRESL